MPKAITVETLMIPVSAAAMTTLPRGVYSTRTEAKNWCAVITRERRSPGGYARRFLSKAQRSPMHFYSVANIQRGDALEFGMNYTREVRAGAMVTKQTNRKRAFAVVIELTADYLLIEVYPTAFRALRRAETLDEATTLSEQWSGISGASEASGA